MRRAWLRGRDKLQRRYLNHISGCNLGLIMRLLTGLGTPRRWADAKIGAIWLHCPVDDQEIDIRHNFIVTKSPHRSIILGIEAGMLTP